MATIPDKFFHLGNKVKFSASFLDRQARDLDRYRNHQPPLSSWRGTIDQYEPGDHDDEIRYSVAWDVPEAAIFDLVICHDGDTGISEYLNPEDCWHDAADIELA